MGAEGDDDQAYPDIMKRQSSGGFGDVTMLPGSLPWFRHRYENFGGGDSFKLQIGGLSSILQPHGSSNHGVRRSKQVSYQ
ncbi:unnamed protein product [Lactuca virosa]|uniref:Uncharacterized protein n=1 Tax=Lactuca virosa TaxID=75947 RepID=A0AAU9MUZ5_9ASTR|nr:unnamed protein product [Lactuca virosa]